MRFSRFLPKGKLKMRDSLFGYMMILTVVILVVIAFGMIILGTFAKPSDTISNTLQLQMEVFEKEITSPVFYKTNGNFNLGNGKVKNGNIYFCEAGIVCVSLEEKH